jgi:hypothetical protein
MRLLKLAAVLAAGAALTMPGLPSRASSHSDAPLIKLDPQANLTDVYAFIRVVNGVKMLNIIVSCRPFSNPGDGVTYEKFSEDALYSIHIADPVTGATRARYDFRFSPVNSGFKNVNTILSYGLGTEVGPIMHVGDARQNYTQTYTVTKVNATSSTVLNGGMTLMCPPANVGPRTTPCYEDINCTPDPNSPTYGQAISGAATTDGLDRYTRETIYTLPGGETVFCGIRDDSFYMDIPGIFDLLNPRILKSDHNGVDDFKGYNVLTYALRVPISSLPIGSSPTLGVYASVSRQRLTLRRTNGPNVDTGPWVQVNRLGNPFFNEALVALKDKDNYNLASPTEDAARFQTYALNPEVAHLINVVYGLGLAETNRTDLAAIFTPDVLKVDTSTGSVPVAGEAAFSRLSIFGGDTVKNGANQDVPAGWPNGRRVGDDVADIAFTAIATDLRTPIGPNHPVVPLGDNVDHNDMVYNLVFPYIATPHSGTFIRHDPVP